jgi:hypothetical protein
MTDLDRMAEVDKAPAKVQVFTQTMGGKTPVVQKVGEYKKVGRGKAPGVMFYDEITGSMDKSQLATIRNWFAKRAMSFLEHEGHIQIS